MKLTTEQVERVKLLATDRGCLTPDVIWQDARSKSSPLHSCFEWNLRKAAEESWRQTAREIIGAVRIVITTQTTTIRAPVYVRDPSVGGDQGYRSVTALRADPPAARASLIYTLETAAGHLRRAMELAQPLGLEQEIDGLLMQITGLQRVLRSEAA